MKLPLDMVRKHALLFIQRPDYKHFPKLVTCTVTAACVPFIPIRKYVARKYFFPLKLSPLLIVTYVV